MYSLPRGDDRRIHMTSRGPSGGSQTGGYSSLAQEPRRGPSGGSQQKAVPSLSPRPCRRPCGGSEPPSARQVSVHQLPSSTRIRPSGGSNGSGAHDDTLNTWCSQLRENTRRKPHGRPATAKEVRRSQPSAAGLSVERRKKVKHSMRCACGTQQKRASMPVRVRSPSGAIMCSRHQLLYRLAPC